MSVVSRQHLAFLLFAVEGQLFELFVNDFPQFYSVSVSLVQINSTKYTFLVCLLQFLQKNQGRGWSHPLVFVVFCLTKVSKIRGPVPGQKQVQQLSRKNEMQMTGREN